MPYGQIRHNAVSHSSVGDFAQISPFWGEMQSMNECHAMN